MDAKTATISLGEPIARGDTAIATLTLRKPKAGELRGLALVDVVRMEASAIVKLVPRISAPALTEQEVGNLEADDFCEVATAIASFFLKADPAPETTTATP